MKILRRFILIAVLLLLPTQAWARYTWYKSTTAGPWGTATSWDLHSGGDGGDGAVPQAGDTVILDNLSANMTGLSADGVCASLTFTGYTATFTHTAGYKITVAGNITLGAGYVAAGATSAFVISATSILTTNGISIGNITYNAVGGTLTLADNLTSIGSFTNTAGTIAPGTFTVTLNGSAVTVTATAAILFHSLNRTPAAPAKTDTLLLGGAAGINIEDTLTVSDGATTSNRVLIASDTIGTSRTITVNAGGTISFSNVDFRDVHLHNVDVDPYDASAIAGGSGNCGGNTGITFTTADDWYWHQGTGNWSDPTKWFTATNGGGSVSTYPPLPQDTAKFDASSFDAGGATVTQDMPRIGSVDFTGVTNSPQFGDIIASMSIFGSITWGAVTLEGYTRTWTWEGRGAYSFTSNGVSFVSKSFILNAPGGSMLILQDALTIDSLTITRGTFNANGQNVTLAGFSGEGTETRGVTLGAGTWTVTGTLYQWELRFIIGLTWDATGSTLKFTGSAATVYMRSGTLVYNNIWVAPGAGTSGFQLAYTSNVSCTGYFKDDGTAAHSILFTAGTTTTAAQFLISGNPGALHTIGSITAAGHILAKSGGGIVNLSNVSVSYSTASPALTFYAGPTPPSVNGGNNSGWTFSGPGGKRLLTTGVGK